MRILELLKSLLSKRSKNGILRKVNFDSTFSKPKKLVVDENSESVTTVDKFEFILGIKGQSPISRNM